VLGRDLTGLKVMSRGLRALEDAELTPLGAAQGPRNVDTQFILNRTDRDPAIAALHRSFFAQSAAVAMTIAA
jgi:aspartate kinase